MNSSISIGCLLIIVSTCLITFLAFRNKDLVWRLIFSSEDILGAKEFYRLFTSAFIHADFQHLLFNMLSFYFFAENVEIFFGALPMLVIYFGSILGGSLLSLWIHRNHEYRSLGASGGVSGIIFAHILLIPGGSFYMFFLPIGIPTWLYAIIFMAGSFYRMKNKKDNIGHEAHLGGAIVGFGIAAGLFPQTIQHSPRLFFSIAGISFLLLSYLIWNPLWLPLSAFGQFPKLKILGRKHSKRNPFDVDQLLDKVSRKGIQSLTDEERSFLNNISQKYRRRADSKKPDSELLF